MKTKYKELKSNLGSGNTIFVGSSNDMFCENYPKEWVYKTLEHCNKFDNKYLFQTKNPKHLLEFKDYYPDVGKVCITAESNRHYPTIMGKALPPDLRLFFTLAFVEPMITIEPIMDFDLIEFVALLKKSEPYQINIGADSCGHNLPEPSKEKTIEFIEELKKFTNVYLKSNLGRIIK